MRLLKYYKRQSFKSEDEIARLPTFRQSCSDAFGKNWRTSRWVNRRAGFALLAKTVSFVFSANLSVFVIHLASATLSM
jgi:hypothetical protein